VTVEAVRRHRRRSRGRAGHARDRGAVDVSVQMLFGMIATLLALLLIVEAVAYWHARNVYDEAAAEGVRVAAAFDGSCDDGVAAAEAFVSMHAGGWGRGADVVCTDGPIVVVRVSGRTPGVLGAAAGFQASVTESAPKER
jgi:hypothetical protein